MTFAFATSRIGFGGYRVADASPVNHAALVDALSAGCDLIDTAPNYMAGDSERLIGRVLAETGAPARVITKAGYAQGPDLDVIDRLALDGEVVSPAPDFRYSIHPAFLAAQLGRSLERLGRARVDGYLLHNPEHLLDTGEVGLDELYARMRRACAFLDEEVACGRVGAYGISSNRLAVTDDAPGTIAFERVLAAAPRLAVVELPCNVVERAAIEPRPGGSLVARLRAAGVTTLANRPLNALAAGLPCRLATYDDGAADPARDQAVIDDALARIARRLREIGVDDDPMTFTPVRMIADRWSRMPSLEAALGVMHGVVRAFLARVWQGVPTGDDGAALARMEATIIACARREASARACAVRAELIADGHLADDAEPFAVAACRYLLDAGIDHVLVGMRAPAYVAQLRPLFTRARAPTAS